MYSLRPVKRRPVNRAEAMPAHDASQPKARHYVGATSTRRANTIVIRSTAWLIAA
jgi:hypothetical protein